MSSYFEDKKEKIDLNLLQEYKLLKYNDDINYCIKHGLKIYPICINKSQFKIGIDYLGEEIIYSEKEVNPFNKNEMLDKEIIFKNKVRYKKDRCIWKQIRAIYKDYYFKLRKLEINGEL